MMMVCKHAQVHIPVYVYVCVCVYMCVCMCAHFQHMPPISLGLSRKAFPRELYF